MQATLIVDVIDEARKRRSDILEGLEPHWVDRPPQRPKHKRKIARLTHHPHRVATDVIDVD